MTMSQAFHSKNANCPFLIGGGEMGALMREMDWSNSILKCRNH